MKKLFLALVLAVPAMAQPPVYVLNAPFNCDASNTRPLTSFYQFDCRGAIFTDPTNGDTAQVFWFSTLGFYWLNASIAAPSVGHKSVVVMDRPPSNGMPGQFQVEWQTLDANGVYHFGIWSGTWEVASGFRSVHPHILTSQTTLDQSTVAILD